MKRTIALASIALALCLSGCKPATTPLPTGAVNTLDAQINEDLQAAHAAVIQYEADVIAGKHTPTANEKVVVNQLIAALNTADPIYQNFHAQLVANPTAGEPQQLIDALAAVTANLNALVALVKGI